MSIESKLQDLIIEHNLKLKNVYQRKNPWIADIIKLDKILITKISKLIKSEKEDKDFDTLREVQDYKDEVKRAGGKVE